MYHVRSIDRINWWHPVVQTKREVFVEKIRALVWTTDDTYRERRRAYWSGALPHPFGSSSVRDRVTGAIEVRWGGGTLLEISGVD
jgi:hypothetical protein